ncbi:MAG: gp16 family protein [Neptuniibacter sp.]
MKPKKDNRKAALAQIHIAKKQLGMDDDVYRDALEQITGKRSCSGMHISELYLVIKHMEKCGFKTKRQSQKTGRSQKKQYSPKSKGQVIDVMRAIWIEMHHEGIVDDGSEMALTRWAERQSSTLNSGVGIAELEWLERTKHVGPVLESLKQWRTRVWKRWLKEDIQAINLLISTENLNPAVAIQRLLDEHYIMYHGAFFDYGIEPDPTYCSNRKELKHV